MMPVFNEIDFDGRVQRCAAALGGRFDVTVLCLDSGRHYSNPSFRTHAVRLPSTPIMKTLKHLYFWAKLWATALRLQPNVVHAHDFFMALPGWVAARISGARFVYDAHELIVPEPGVTKTVRERVFYLGERLVVRRADLVIAANSPRAERMQAHYDLSRTPLVIENIPESPQKPPSAVVATIGGSEKIRLVYQGDMSLDRGIGDFVLAMKALDPRYELLLVGGGPDVERLRALAGEPGISGKVRLLGKVPRDELHGILLGCHIGVVTYPATGLNNLLCAPNKIYEYAQAGLPMIARENPTLRSIFARYPVGVVSADLAGAIDHLAKSIDDYKANIPAFLADNNWNREASKLLEAYEKLA
jgi:hypothetical protein